MALAPPPPPPTSTSAPLLPAPARLLELDDLPYARSVAGATRGRATADRPARVGLVLAVVVALAGVLGAATRSDPADGSDLASGGGTGIVEDRPVDGEDAQSEPTEPGAPGPIVVPDGFHVVQGDGIHLAVPAAWVALPPEEQGLDEGTLDELFPDLDESVRDAAVEGFDDGALLLAVDSSPGGIGANINVASVIGELPLDALASAVPGELEDSGLGAVVGETSQIDTPLGRALRMAYTVDVGGQQVPGVQFYVPAGGETFVLTGTGDVAAADHAVQTLRLGEAPTPD